LFYKEILYNFKKKFTNFSVEKSRSFLILVVVIGEGGRL